MDAFQIVKNLALSPYMMEIYEESDSSLRLIISIIMAKNAWSATKFCYKNCNLFTYKVQLIRKLLDVKEYPFPRTMLCIVDKTKVWHAMPSSIKESQTLNNFKRKIQSYNFDCSCRLCRLYTGNLGFL